MEYHTIYGKLIEPSGLIFVESKDSISLLTKVITGNKWRYIGFYITIDNIKKLYLFSVFDGVYIENGSIEYIQDNTINTYIELRELNLLSTERKKLHDILEQQVTDVFNMSIKQYVVKDIKRNGYTIVNSVLREIFGITTKSSNTIILPRYNECAKR